MIMAEQGYRGAIIATADEVREVVAKYMADAGVAGSWTVTWRTPQLLGFESGSWPGDRYKAQVLRALNMMADRGELIKVGRGERKPDGSTVGAYPLFYTRPTWLARKRDADDQAAADRASRQRWEKLYADAARLGIVMTNLPGQPLALSQQMWRELLRRLGD